MTFSYAHRDSLLVDEDKLLFFSLKYFIEKKTHLRRASRSILSLVAIPGVLKKKHLDEIKTVNA
jgi:hypothetical protein